MKEDSPQIIFIEGHDLRRRGIAWLQISNNAAVDAKKVFDNLRESRKDYLHASFDSWLARKDIPSRYHGWTGEFKACFQFNYKDQNGNNRFYGFLIHPDFPDERFEMCVLAMHATKHQANTEPFFKYSMVKFANNAEIKKAIVRQIKEKLNEE